MRLGVYTDYSYHLVGGRPHAERAFALFIAALAGQAGIETVVVLGRLDPSPEGGRYPLGAVSFVALPFYPRLTALLPALRGMAGSLRRYWRSLDDLDAVWLLGPHPLAIAFALMARLRGRRVVLGVRQQFVSYIGSRHSGSRVAVLMALVLERAFRLIARRADTIVVGPAIAADYRHAKRVLEISVSLVHEDRIATPAQIASRSYEGELVALSVGRLDPEKNPLALADVLARLNAGGARWRLLVCGEGSLSDELAERLAALGQDGQAELLGYLPHGAGLEDAYVRSNALLHVSWTEGLPQVLFEAFAAGVPVVATAVGGIREAVGDAALLVEAGDPDASAAALQRLAGNPELRERLIGSGLELARRSTIEAESARVAEFLAGPAR
jgi:glycosyltransferase involved in cell wall biosynthesis